MAKIWVYAEQSHGRPAATALELLTRARQLGDVDAITLGPGATSAAAALGRYGAGRVLVNEDPAFAEYLAEPATDCLAALVPAESPDLVLFSFSSDSREVAGRLAARLNTGLISNALDIEAAGDGFVAKVPYFGGAKVATYRANARPAIVLIRPKSYEAAESGGEAQVVEVDAAIGEGSRRSRIVETRVEAGEKIKLEDALVVVSGGRGLGGPENFHYIEELADALGGAAGASRAVVDAGWGLHRGRDLGRHAAHGRHEGLQSDRRHQQGPRRTHPQDGGPGRRRRRAEDPAQADGGGKGQEGQLVGRGVSGCFWTRPPTLTLPLRGGGNK